MKLLKDYDCVIIGGGPAGIGMASVLQDLGMKRFVILEQHEIGASFMAWPKEMRLITPSFTSNAYGMLDLNAVVLNTSPAYTLGSEHPTGKEYATYLQAVAQYKKLPVKTGVVVSEVIPQGQEYKLMTSHGEINSRFVIWAAGEFQYPKLDSFPGAEYGIHSSLFTEWAEVQGEEFIIVGGYESGIDAAIHLSGQGKQVTVIDRDHRSLAKGSSDPSVELSPYTKDRLRLAMANNKITILHGFEVQWIEAEDDGGYVLYCENESADTRLIKTMQPPILATGFQSSLKTIEHLIERNQEGELKLSTADESTINPGLFITGPQVVHGNLQLCFIYKYRQRFAVVAQAIAQRLDMDVSILSQYREAGMFLDDLSCCGEDCKC
ncbi:MULTISPECIES: NAD(P)/FAD-dependent oxidoreductase [unclassified Paenibacillus]|uniref:NAD(P)/FAD-dependent oxidoreductase n=1 Tax=Paenibacillus provencensis TaxID=441151 RepID=A0ABW3PTC6_9BACL|nr:MULTISPECIES: NAD(P)/FAD-dependent oxidoreductase [unclassified Paenibacillus]MCM3127140.1 NAD(P)-binding domain-containing protein [Paenibacillus sp. MER 78]SFS55660.1 Pyridine nucleotide-disulphide oxidoreductase [Paenibacillus sp. 453mf]